MGSHLVDVCFQQLRCAADGAQVLAQARVPRTIRSDGKLFFRRSLGEVIGFDGRARWRRLFFVAQVAQGH